MKLSNLPTVILLCIMGFLEIEDQFNLGLCCKHLHFFLDDKICRENLLNYAPFSVNPGSDARSWRSLVKRIIAVKTARPWLLSAIAVCRSFIYNDGVVVYCVEQSIRTLHLQGSVTEEIAIDVRRMLQATQLDGFRLEGLTLLHYSRGFVSCLLQVRGENTQYWLLSCHAEREIFQTYEL
ncbi:unnamed protein product, partial [Clonostachys chloroleuca]